VQVQGLGDTRIERFEHGDFSVDIYLPQSSEALIDELDFDEDERLPYWAELWPSARALARYLLDLQPVPDSAIELGSGVALPSLALLRRGVKVVATDYYDDALVFARHNAKANRMPPLATDLLDWRDSPERLGRFPLVVAADVLYESRNGEALAVLLPQLLEPGGVALIADPGRVYVGDFLNRMRASDWEVELLSEMMEDSSGGGAMQTRVQILALRHGATG
jgi:predicted nicotinamide N-methyase